jgi:glutamine amidotransferase
LTLSGSLHELDPALLDASGEAVSIGILDYGMGNRRSVQKAFAHIGTRVILTSETEALARCGGLVIPGVGAFPRGMANLQRLGLVEFLRERVGAGTPVLGICLGMQLAFERSSELGGAEGIGLIAGEVRELRAGGNRLPHIGWNRATFSRPGALTEGLGEHADFYHVHTYACEPADPADVLARVEYGESFATLVARGSFYGAQFHPEKSSTLGLRLLANFATICARHA